MPRIRSNEGEVGSDPYHEHQERISKLHIIMYDLRDTTQNLPLSEVREHLANTIEILLKELSHK